MDHGAGSRARSTSRKRHAEGGGESEGPRSKSRSQTPPGEVGGAAATQEGLSSYGKALSGDVKGQTAGGASVKCFPPGDGLSNSKETPIREHLEAAQQGLKSRWGTISMPLMPLTNGGELTPTNPDDFCTHGLLWRDCFQKATWKVAVLCHLGPIESYRGDDAPSRMGYGFCVHHMKSWYDVP